MTLRAQPQVSVPVIAQPTHSPGAQLGATGPHMTPPRPNNEGGAYPAPPTLGDTEDSTLRLGMFPAAAEAFSVLAQGDNPAAGAYVPFRSPDNLDTSRKSLMVQEDTGSARIWQSPPSSVRLAAARCPGPRIEPDGELGQRCPHQAGEWPTTAGEDPGVINRDVGPSDRVNQLRWRSTSRWP